jgi:hypothetical protein
VRTNIRSRLSVGIRGYGGILHPPDSERALSTNRRVWQRLELVPDETSSLPAE